ncbi:MAG: DUF2271 domain-containing protein [Treponema sp.]|nr:DUF2271 domain-containing protein [Treponema sp.]
MNRIFFGALLMVFALTGAAAQQAAAELSFSFARQSGSGSNQFAVWVEDAQGVHVKTLYATRFTANGGWKRRPTSIPLWVKQSSLSGMNKAQVDALTGATPKSGSLTYRWDGADSRGAPLPAGNYALILEGTLRGDNQVVYRAPIRLGQGPVAAEVSVEYIGKADSERAMIGSVTARALR